MLSFRFGRISNCSNLLKDAAARLESRLLNVFFRKRDDATPISQQVSRPTFPCQCRQFNMDTVGKISGFTLKDLSINVDPDLVLT